jgi:HAD-hyrolase-like
VRPHPADSAAIAAGRSKHTPGQTTRQDTRFVECLRSQDVRLDGCYYCPHAPEDGCPCRKPATGLLERGAAAWGIDLERLWLIGDKASDVEAGWRAGCDTVLRAAGTMAVSDVRADCAAANWEEAVGWILRPSAESWCREPSGTECARRAALGPGHDPTGPARLAGPTSVGPPRLPGPTASRCREPSGTGCARRAAL